MKNSKPLVSLMVFAIIFACVLSCDEQNEKPETKSKLKSGSRTVNARTGSSDALTAEMNFDGTEGDALDLMTAKNWTSNFRGATEDANETRAHYFGFEIIQQILGQPDCVGIRMYYAIDDAGEKKLLLVGVNAEGQDLLPGSSGKTDGEGYVVADFSYPCPSYCSGGSGSGL